MTEIAEEEVTEGGAGALSAESPFPKRFAAYLEERFPLGVNGTAIVLMFSSSYLAASRLLLSEESLLSWRVPVGMLVLFFFFLRLRISDEHKDVAYDRIVNPDRLVVKGVITLNELKLVGLLGLVVEAGGSWVLGQRVFYAYLAALFWSLLMHMEFFCESWLRARPGAYMFSHMIIIPLLTLFCFECANTKEYTGSLVALLLFALAGALATASLETARKIKLPADESEGVESYSSAWGFGASLVVVGLMQLLSFLLLFGIRHELQLGTGFLSAALGAYGLVCLSLLRFGLAKDARFSGKLEKVAALYYLAVNIGLTLSLLR